MQVKYKIAITLLLTALLTLGLKIRLYPPLVNTELRTEFWLNKTYASADYSVVVGGDSRIYRGFSIDDMEGELTSDLNGLNLGYSSAGFSSSYIDFMANHLKLSGPRILVFGLSPHAFTDESISDELLNQYRSVKGFDRYKGLYLSRYLKHFAPYKISDLPSAWTGDYEGRVEETFYKNGWVASDQNREIDSVALDIYTNIFTKMDVNEIIIDRFMQQVDSLHKTGIAVFAFRPPTNAKMVALEDSLSAYREEEIANRFKSVGGVWIDLPVAEFRTYDGSHLDSKSARLLGKKIGQAIRQTLID